MSVYEQGARVRLPWIGVVVAIAAARSVRAQQLVVSAEQVQTACSAVAGGPVPAGGPSPADPILSAFCALNAPTTVARAEGWIKMPVPTAQAVLAAAGIDSAHASHLFRSSDFGPSQRFGTGFVTTFQSQLIWATTDFLIERAKTDLGAFVVSRYVAATCDSTRMGKAGFSIVQFLPETCGLLLRQSSDASTLPGISQTHSALQHDVAELPARTMSAMLARYARDASDLVRRDRVLTASAAFYYVALTLDSHDRDPYRGFVALDDSLTRLIDTFDLHVDSAPTFRNLLGTLALARLLPRDQTLQTDSGALIAMKALAINLADSGSSKRWSKLLRPDVSDACKPRCVPFRALPMWHVATTIAEEARVIESARRRTEEASRQNALTYAHIVGAAVPAILGRLDDSVCDSTLDRMRGVISRVGRIEESIVAQRYGEIVSHLSTVVATVDGNDASWARIGRVLGFSADLAEATDAASMQEAMERFVAPRGAYSRKRMPPVSGSSKYVTLNAYAGGAGTFEWASNEGAPVAAPYLSIGLELGWSKQAVGIFLQLVDLGQLAAYRLGGNDSIDVSPPAVTVAHVFSPGLYFVKAVRTMPISLGVGASWSPRFRSLNTDAALPSRSVDAFRLGTFVAVDLPLLP